MPDDKEQAIKQADEIIGREQALRTITEIVSHASYHAEQPFVLTGNWIVQFEMLVRTYAQDLEQIILGRTIYDMVHGEDEAGEVT